MPQQSSVSRLAPVASATDGRPVLECAAPGTDQVAHDLRIRAGRRYATTADELYAAWTRRGAWESWLRLRARSRATLAPYRGGGFRLELAEGPTIHVITGVVLDVQPETLLSFSWIHDGAVDQSSIVDLTFRPGGDATELALLHRSIANRRHAAWLMRLWTSALDRLDHYVKDAMPVPRRLGFFADRAVQPGEREPHRRAASHSTNHGASSAA